MSSQINHTATRLSDRIKLARNKVGLTQQELAEKLGIAYPTLNKYEKGHRTPDAELLNQMVKILDCDPGWLLTGEGSRERGGHEAREEGPKYIVSKGVDLDLMETVIESVEEAFEEEKMYLPAPKKARLIILLYKEMIERNANKPERGKIIELTRLAS